MAGSVEVVCRGAACVKRKEIQIMTGNLYNVYLTVSFSFLDFQVNNIATLFASLLPQCHIFTEEYPGLVWHSHSHNRGLKEEEERRG